MPRQIGFSTYCETFTGADYTAAEWEFVRAMSAYQKRWNRRYPSWREVLAVVAALGYRKVGPAADAPGEVLAGPAPDPLPVADAG